MGNGMRHVLAIESDDPVLSWVGPIGLACSVGTALIVDLTAETARGGRALSDLLEYGPSLGELSPGRRGVATIAGGGVEVSALGPTIEALARSWPAVVIRGPACLDAVPTIRYRGLYPGGLVARTDTPSVWQSCAGASPTRVRGPVLPRLRRSQVVAMLDGRRPTGRKWVAAWRAVWEMPWA